MTISFSRTESSRVILADAFDEHKIGWAIKVNDSNTANNIFLLFKTITIFIVCIVVEIIRVKIFNFFK